MKRLLLIFVSVATLLAGGCNNYDDSDLQNRVDDLENRVSALEEICRTINSDIKSMQKLVGALDSYNYIVGVEGITKSDVTGYKITFLDGTSIEILNGAKGDKGDDGQKGETGAKGDKGDTYKPAITVGEDESGDLCWKVDGQWLTDNEGNHVKARGSDGKDGTGSKGDDGITPQLKIEAGFWWISYDEGASWRQLGEYKDGSEYENNSLFSDVQVSEENNCVTFTLKEGQELVVPLYIELAIAFDESGLIEMHPKSTREIPYEITGNEGNLSIEALYAGGVKAKIVKESEKTGKLVITTGESIDTVYDRVVVLVSNGFRTIMTGIAFESPVLTIKSETLFEVPAEGGDVNVTVSTNARYSVSIPEEAQSWITNAGTRAPMREETVTLTVAPNDGGSRYAKIELVDRDGYKHGEFVVRQEGETIPGVTMPEVVNLPSSSIAPQEVPIVSADENLTISCEASWMGIVGGTATVAAGQADGKIKLWSEPNFSASERTAIVTVEGATSSKSAQITVAQAPCFTSIEESFPSRLETQSSMCDYTKWTGSGLCSPAGGSAMLCAVAPSGNILNYSQSSGPIVANLAVGDYLLYAVPTRGVAAGEQIDFMCTIAAMASSSPKYFIFEYWDENQWKSVEGSLHTDAAVNYSLKLFSASHYTTFAQSFALSQPVENGCVKVRLRTLSAGTGGIRIPAQNGYMGMYMIKYPNAVPVTDTKKLLFVGNSFTYFYGTPFMFKEIARTQGHQVEAVISVKGAQEFSEHLNLELTRDAIMQGGYDFALLQDTSPNPAIYADPETSAERKAEILAASRQINELTLTYSPSCQIVYERTWACPSHDNYRGYGSYDKLDYLLKTGSEMLQRELAEYNIRVSPIGLGFREGRGENLDMLYSDDRHQNRVGAYMKACINYLFIYKTRFTGEVSDCAVDAATAAKVREIAERVVFDGVDEEYDFSTTGPVDAANCYIVDKAGEYSFRADVMGNGNIPAGSAISSAKLKGKGAKVLWSSYNTTTAPASDDELVSNVTLKEGYISFTAGADGSLREGNAVIALYDDAECTGNILWSWHIWLCKSVGEQSCNGHVWLDRNIGALSSEAGNVLSLGFLYQFGRKDPFRGSAALSGDTAMATTGSWPEITNTVSATPEAYVIANPMQVISKPSSGTTYDWYSTTTGGQNHALWESSGKTMYDPCPKGYRVPRRSDYVDPTTGSLFFTVSNFPFDSQTRCRIYEDADTKVVYPIAGTIGSTGVFTVADKGYYRTATNEANAKYSDVLEFTTANTSASTSLRLNGNYRCSAYSVRCVKEE